MTEAPEKPKVARRLAAILAADIAGYSALMGADEARTVGDLKSHQAVILPMMSDHGGRIIDTAGDGILAEFASIVNAVECALAIQKVMAGRNVNIASDRRMQFRIGINLGDVIHDDARLYGDGVNIAARLESIAEPGGICLSAEAFTQVQRKLSLNVTDVGEQQLKNITQPVRVFRIAPAEPTGINSQSGPALSLPDKPSIAVLPFTNLSGDPKEDYFSDGITEDIITELSRFSELFVVARNSSFQYKGRSPDIRQVGRELGVRYVLEGSIRRAGNHVRITGQLIDATTGTHRWAERYDRKLEDVFALQDEVARTIVAILAAHVNKAEAERTALKPPATWKAQDHYFRANDAFTAYLSSFKPSDLYEARRFLEDSLSIDPSYSRAYALLSNTHLTAWIQPLDSDYQNPAALDRADDAARKAVRLDPNLPSAHAHLGSVLTWKGQHDESLDEFERAAELNPNFTEWRYARALVFAGNPMKAVHLLHVHMRLDPFYVPLACGWLGFAHYMVESYAEALRPLRECVSRAPNFRGGHLWLAAVYGKLGQLELARAEAAEVLRIEPDYTIQGTQNMFDFFKRAQDTEHYYDGLRKAGLPE